MVAAHVAHDCIVGDHVVLVNQATLGGHVQLGDHVIIGGLSAVQQWVRIGAHAFIAGHSGITADLIPFGMGFGRNSRLGGLNLVGLKRRGFDRPTIHALRAAYRSLFEDEAGTFTERLDQVAAEHAAIPAVMSVVEFIRTGNGARLCLARPENAD
jgi:UDP-N-acetylglucosamine acyltransferase